MIFSSSCEKYLSKRWVKHKSSMNNERDKTLSLYKKMNELDVENFYIELIENYPCENNDELRAREGHYIRELSTLNKKVETFTKKTIKSISKNMIKGIIKNIREDEVPENQGTV